MTWPIPDLQQGVAAIELANDRISAKDAVRQAKTVYELVNRLASQPGLILADEVGMGKTFVALSVAAVVAMADKGRRPVVIMVPSSLQQKWPRDFEVFRNRCLPHELRKRLTAGQAGSALEFFRMLDATPAHRPRIIFLSHGAFHGVNFDAWMKLAIIKRAINGLHLGERRTALPRFAAELLRVKVRHSDDELFALLLDAQYEDWKDAINRFYAGQPGMQVTQDPVPYALCKVLRSDGLQLGNLRECLRTLPARSSDSLNERLGTVRVAINDALRDIWPKVLSLARFKSPLLILDEAHHLKNPSTRLASLFESTSAEEVFDDVAGPLSGTFERMLFLTATPFQLGHYELLNVLSRFRGIAWRSLRAHDVAWYDDVCKNLRELLDTAQRAAADLDRKWQLLSQADLRGEDGVTGDLEAWWARVLAKPEAQPERVQIVQRSYLQAHKAMKGAENVLRHWVVRHLRDRKLPESNIDRRFRVTGQGIRPDAESQSGGLTIASDSMLPFLLAARAEAALARAARKGTLGKRATFADGLASSYEAFLDTRSNARSAVDEVEVDTGSANGPEVRYLGKLTEALPDAASYHAHPKMSALVARVVRLWEQGEKVVVFCHFKQTGKALVRHISVSLEKRLWQVAADRLNISEEEAEQAVRSFPRRFDQGEPMQLLLNAELDRMMEPYSQLSPDERQYIQDVVRRFVRTPIFVGRYFDVTQRASAALLEAALDTQDLSGVSLRQKLEGFLQFIAVRCEERERKDYLDALSKVHPGLRDEPPADRASDEKGVELLPNVRLANGDVAQESRQRMMLSFNTPFFPEVLVASSVLAEGVDLHLNCRYVIHYDLCWNPSTLEQRTGRVDRIGAKAEKVMKSIEIFLPYITGTQDEKAYRVVMDRERWFQVLMGEKYPEDELVARAIAERVPLPLTAAEELAFNLSVGGGEHHVAGSTASAA